MNGEGVDDGEGGDGWWNCDYEDDGTAMTFHHRSAPVRSLVERKPQSH